ncbi:MAG: ATP-binding protein [Acidimicrobiia bacterium]
MTANPGQRSPGAEPEWDIGSLRAEVARLRAAYSAVSQTADVRSRFLAHISHELRTPMNSILGMARLAMATELTPEQREYLDVIQESTESLMTLVNDLLDQAKIDAGMLLVEAIPFRLDDLLRGALRGIRILTNHKGLELQYELDEGLPELVVGDPTRLRQIVLNLVGNAAKFTESGTIAVTVAAAQDAPECVLFNVTDTGIGIAPEKLETIFEEFRQSDESTTRRYGGTGLGLSISDRLVELMGGTMTVTSQVGAGSTFEFRVPLPAAPDVVAPLRPASAGATSVLWLTHERAPHHPLLAAVADAGIAPEVHTSVTAALAELRTGTQAPAAVVVDLQNGALDAAWELGREIAGAPLVVLTPGGQRGDAARCREIGVAAYLTGPIVPADVVDTLEAVVGGVSDLVTRHWLAERRRSLRILVADDSATNRSLLARLLGSRGHRTLTAADGGEVLAIVQSEPVDVILLDLHMPRLDGFQAAEQVRALDGAAASTPIIAVSGSIGDPGRVRCAEIGIDEFVAKPFQPEQLLELVEQLGA